MTTFAIGELPSKMKSLLRIFGLTILSLTMTNCSLSPEQIAEAEEHATFTGVMAGVTS